MATAEKKRRKRAVRRRELIAGVVTLSAVLLALIAVAVALFSGESPQAISKPKLEPLPTLQEQTPNPYPKADYLYDGQRMTLADGQGIPGIDVSRYQGNIDWEKVASSGVKFVFIRIGYRTYGSGEITADPNAQANYQGAKAAGLKVGVYFFSQATNSLEAMEEAEWTMKAIAPWQLDLPVVYDWELPAPDARTKNVTAGQLTAYTRIFNRILKNNGYSVMLYFNRHHAAQRLYMHRLTDMPHWFAMYADTMTYPYDFAIWQYSQTGRVPGIQGDVDLNIMLPGTELWEITAGK